MVKWFGELSLDRNVDVWVRERLSSSGIWDRFVCDREVEGYRKVIGAWDVMYFVGKEER
jgi:hypothetical protein